jgi:ANTAR domain-containing protein
VSQDKLDRRADDACDPVRDELDREALERELRRLRTELAQLRRALESRPVIDQARGMVMAIGPCTAEAAWAVLVESSQRTNTKLRNVAEALVASTDGTTPIPLPLRSALAASLRTHRSRNPR